MGDNRIHFVQNAVPIFNVANPMHGPPQFFCYFLLRESLLFTVSHDDPAQSFLGFL